MSAFNPLWGVIQDYMDDPKHRYPPKPADLARETGVSEQVLSKWKQRPVLPEPELLMKVATGTGIRYSVLLLNALYGRDYLPPRQDAVLQEDFDGIVPDNDWVDSWMRNFLELDRRELHLLKAIQERNAIIADLLEGGDGTGVTTRSAKARKWATAKVAPILARRRGQTLAGGDGDADDTGRSAPTSENPEPVTVEPEDVFTNVEQLESSDKPRD